MVKIRQKSTYVNNPLALRAGTNIAALRQNHYVTNLDLQQKLGAWDTTYGRSPVVNDNAGAGQLLGDRVLRHIAIA